MSERELVSLPVTDCARCNGEHKSLLFEKLLHFSRVSDVTMAYWAMCPDVEQPVMLGVRPPGAAYRPDRDRRASRANGPLAVGFRFASGHAKAGPGSPLGEDRALLLSLHTEEGSRGDEVTVAEE